MLEQLRAKPHLQSDPQRGLGGRLNPAKVGAADPHRVGAQVMVDDLKLALDDPPVQLRPGGRPPEAATDVITDAQTPSITGPPSLRIVAHANTGSVRWLARG